MLSMKERKKFALEFFLCLDFIDFPRAGEILPTRCLFAFHQQFVMDFFLRGILNSHRITSTTLGLVFMYLCPDWDSFLPFLFVFFTNFPPRRRNPLFFKGEMISAEVVILFASVFGRIRYLRVY